jgi:hypothetical protein
LNAEKRRNGEWAVPRSPTQRGSHAAGALLLIRSTPAYASLRSAAGAGPVCGGRAQLGPDRVRRLHGRRAPAQTRDRSGHSVACAWVSRRPPLNAWPPSPFLRFSELNILRSLRVLRPSGSRVQWLRALVPERAIKHGGAEERSESFYTKDAPDPPTPCSRRAVAGPQRQSKVTG